MNRSITSAVCSIVTISVIAIVALQPVNSSAQLENEQGISLNQAIRLALENNTSVKIEDINKSIANDRILLAETAFDYEIRSSYRYESINRPQNQQDLIATGGGNLILDEPRIFLERNQRFDSGIGKRTRYGSDIELGTRWSQLDNTLNRDLPPSLFNPEYTTFTGLTLTQPLLRDFGRRVNTAPIEIARTDAQIASLNWMGQVQGTIGGVIKRYVDLAAAYRGLGVRDEAVALAQKLVADNQARRDEGKMADIDVQEAEVAVSIRQEERIAAENDYIERLNALRVLINPVDNPRRGGRLLPTTPFKTSVPNLDDRETLIAMAKENRDDYQIAKLELDREEIRVDYAKNQTKPRLDLLTSAGIYGLDGDLGGTYGKAFSGQGPEWSVGVQISFPLGNRQAKQQLAIARRQVEQAKLREQQLDLVVDLELDTVISRILTASKRLETVRKTTKLADSFLQLETERMNEGKSTSFQVLEKQTDLSASRTRELVAAADLERSLVDVWIVTGTLLDRYDVNVADHAPVAQVKKSDSEIEIDYSAFKKGDQ